MTEQIANWWIQRTYSGEEGVVNERYGEREK
jgi:hypothetical protein